MVKLEITSIRETQDPYTPEGKKYTVYKWKIQGKADGKPVEAYLTTLSKQAADTVAEGAVLYAEPDPFKGHVNYKLPKPDSNSRPQSQGSGQSQPPSSSYSLRDLEKLADWAWGYAFKRFEDTGREVTAPIGSTLFIQATRLGLKAESLNQQTDAAFTDAEKIAKALRDAKVSDKVKSAGIDMPTLQEWFKASKGDIQKLLYRVHQAIKDKEEEENRFSDGSGSDDSVPF